MPAPFFTESLSKFDKEKICQGENVSCKDFRLVTLTSCGDFQVYVRKN